MAPATVVALLLFVASAAQAGQATPKPPNFQSGHGLRVTSAHMLTRRQLDVGVSSHALGRGVDVRILLPNGYAAHPDRRYPVLYLFHGTSGRASDWVRMGDATKTTAHRPLITVMADAGFDGDGGGWFTNWWNGGALGPPKWETFHIHQLIPWVDANLRTIAARRGRAIAGLSQGGFGALSYAARHPDLFGTVASFSGAAEIDRDPQAIALVTPVIEGTATGLDHSSDPDAMFGPRATNEINWQAHDPATLVPNLRHTGIWLWTGNGQPGPLDSGSPNPGAEAIEGGVHTLTMLFHGHLQDAHIPSHYDDYGPGTHTWPYWTRDLKQFMGPLMRRFAHPPRRPRAITYKSADDLWRQWGWLVAMDRPARAFSALHHARPRHFEISGDGTAHVTTPAAFRPHARLRVKLPSGWTDAKADGKGRLSITVPLGPSRARAKVRVRAR
jgi:S-formylglutathione hydrolase FrmB